VLDIALIAAATWAILLAAGMALVALTPARARPSLLPATPALGAAGLVVVLHVSGLVRPAGTTAPIIVAALAVSLPFSLRALWRPRLPAWSKRLFAGCSALGVGVAAFALVPVLLAGRATVVDPGVGNDSLAFVSLTDWFEHHTLPATPHLRVDPPAYGYVRTHQGLSARVGQDLLQATLAAALHKDPSQTWYAVTCAWLALLPGTVAAAGLLLYRSRITAVAAGAGAAASATVIGQVFNQNSASLLGIALAPLGLAVIVTHLEPARELAVGADAGPPWPAWVGAVVLAGLIGAYSEYLAILVPFAVLYALFSLAPVFASPS